MDDSETLYKTDQETLEAEIIGGEANEEFDVEENGSASLLSEKVKTHHTRSIILVHDIGDNALEFGDQFLGHKMNGRSIVDIYPCTKWCFPQINYLWSNETNKKIADLWAAYRESCHPMDSARILKAIKQIDPSENYAKMVNLWAMYDDPRSSHEKIRVEIRELSLKANNPKIHDLWFMFESTLDPAQGLHILAEIRQILLNPKRAENTDLWTATFDMDADEKTIAYAKLKQMLQPLRETVKREMDLVGPQNVFIGGLFAGATAALHVLGSYHGRRGLGGFIGLGGKLPFHRDISAIIEHELTTAKTAPLEEFLTRENLQMKVANFFRHTLNMPKIDTGECCPGICQTPMFLGGQMAYGPDRERDALRVIMIDLLTSLGIIYPIQSTAEYLGPDFRVQMEFIVEFLEIAGCVRNLDNFGRWKGKGKLMPLLNRG